MVPQYSEPQHDDSVVDTRGVGSPPRPDFGVPPDAEKSMADNLELGLFLAVLMAFVVCGCLVTRVPKKVPDTGPVKP